jgi:hypothetical protein
MKNAKPAPSASSAPKDINAVIIAKTHSRVNIKKSEGVIAQFDACTRHPERFLDSL